MQTTALKPAKTDRYSLMVCRMANIRSINILDKFPKAPNTAVAVVIGPLSSQLVNCNPVEALYSSQNKIFAQSIDDTFCAIVSRAHT